MLGECFTERNERSGIGELISVTMSAGVVKASELNRSDNSSADKSNYKKVEVGDIAYNSMRMWQGACGFSNYSGILSPAYTVVIPQDNIDVAYFYYLFKTNDSLYKFRINSQGLTSDTWNLKYPSFSTIESSYPATKVEQERIGQFFLSIDKQINALGIKIGTVRNMKQALRQKMFV